MFRALALVFVLPLTALAQDPPSKKPVDPLARQLTVLHEKKVASFGEASIKDTTLRAVMYKLEREFKDDGLKFIVREDLFRLQYPDLESFSTEKFKLDLSPNGMTVHDFLMVALADLRAVYLVRRNYLEIVPPASAVAECFSDGEEEQMPLVRLRREPLVSHFAVEQPLDQVVKAVVDRFGKAAVIDPTIGELRTKPISANWTNVPFPTAIRLLALDAGLDVKETGGVLTITKPAPKKKGK